MSASDVKSPLKGILLTVVVAVVLLLVLILSNCVKYGSSFPEVIFYELRNYGILAWRLALALALSIVIGADRERHDKPAGLRTVAMVGVGGCLFGLMASLAFVGDASSRIVQGLITGIGFLGAGTIIKERFRIEGLTTAATIWTVSGVGLATGMGLYPMAIIATIAVLFVLTILRLFESRRRHGNGSAGEDSPED